MLKHIFYTWLLANLLLPVCLLLFFMGEEREFTLVWFFLFPISIFFSSPCLFVGWACLFIIDRSSNPVAIKFALWLLTAPSLAFLACMVVLQQIGLWDRDALEFTIPAMLATALAVLIRYSYFKKSFDSPINVQA